MYYVSMDGGGTKVLAILFDENFNLISTARAGGIHLTVNSQADVDKHSEELFLKLFETLPRPSHIQKIYFTCGDYDWKPLNYLPEGITCNDATFIGESEAALIAGLCRRDGFLAISGTGSDVFCIKEGKRIDDIGGWGAIIGDEGSGVWMSRLAMQTAITYLEDWGEKPTTFGDLVVEHFGFTELWDYVHYLYSASSPLRRLGELLPIVAKAANQGDEAMLDVFKTGGTMLARQMIAMLKRHPEEDKIVTICGGAWKAHPIMAQTFISLIKKQFPDAQISLPLFEHVMFGPMLIAMEGGEMRQDIIQKLTKNFEDFTWNKQ